MNFDNARHISIDGKETVRLEIGGEVVWKGVPSGYKRLDYIETTGTQYIDTEFTPDQDSRVVTRFKYNSGQHIYGARQTASSATNAKQNFAFRVTSGDWQPCYGYTLGSTGVSADTKWHIADQNKNIFTLDGVELDSGDELTEGTTVENGILTKVFDVQTFTAPLTFLIGAINSAASGGIIYKGKTRFGTVQLYDNGVLVRDFIPCKDPDGNIGMYDTVNAKFYGNAGEDEFVAGAEI